MARKLEKAEWQPFFDALSKALPEKRAEIAVESLDLGDQIQAQWLPLQGMVYDPKDDLVEIALDELDHLVHHPREIYAEEAGTGVRSVMIVDADQRRHVVTLRDPVMLVQEGKPR